MNICYVAPDVALPHYRGSSTHVYEVSKNLANQGQNVVVISRRLRSSEPVWERMDGFLVYRTFQGLLGEPPLTSYQQSHLDSASDGLVRRLYGFYLTSFRALQLGIEVAVAVRSFGIDLVFERETALGAGAVCSEVMGVPLVLEVIGGRYSSLSLKRAARVISYSSQMVEGRVPTDRLDVVSAAVDIGLFSPNPSRGASVRSQLGIGAAPLVGYVGTFPVYHGVETLLKAGRGLIAKEPNTKFLLVGPYYADARNRARELGIEKNVLFTGPVSYQSVPDYMNACDVLCAPYRPEFSSFRSRFGMTSPLKIMEYMACMKPVVSTRIHPIPEIMRDGEEGLLVDPGDAEGLQAALERLLGDPRLRERLSKAARERAVEDFTWKALAVRFSAILDRAIKES